MKLVNSIILGLLIALSACNNSNDGNSETNTDTIASVKLVTDSNTITAAIDTAHNAQTSLDWAGTYSGIVPCADCEGIETSLTLNTDKSYALSRTYKGKAMEASVIRGAFTWINGSTVELSGMTDAPARYFVGENKIFQLDMEGKRITGDLETKYILTKK